MSALRTRYLPLLVVVAAYPVLGLLMGGDFHSTLLLVGGILALTGIGLDVCIGGAGLLVFSAPAFMLVGALTTALVTSADDPWGGPAWSPLIGVLFGVGITIATAGVVSLVTLRLSGLGLGLVTLFLLFAGATIAQNLDVLGGTSGLSGVPSFRVGDLVFDDPEQKLLLVAALLLVLGVLAIRYLRSDVGRELAAIRDDEVAAAASGVRISRRKIEAFVFSSIPASVSGSLLAHELHYASPDVFPVSLLLDILLMLYIGGVGRVWGVVLGAPLVEVASDFLNRVGDWGLAVKGIAFVVVLVFLPGGLAGLFQRARRRRREQVAPPAVTAPIAPPAVVPSPEGGPLLELDGVERRFGGLLAVAGVSLTVPAGETYALLGPNGAGKTTLFNLISGALPPTAGSITLAGRDVTGWSGTRMAREGVTRTFQNVRLFTGLTVLDNVLVGTGAANRSGLGSAWRPGSDARGRDDALAACALFGLLDLLDEPVGGLPIGVQRRVEMARAMARRPRLLLLDEPASGLSSPERDELATILRRVADTPTTMVIVEHDISFVSALATRGMVLDHGTTIFDGPMDELLRHPDVVAAYLGDALTEEVA